MLATSFLLSFSIPPLNFPTLGPPMLRSLFVADRFSFDTFSRIIPFSLASFRRVFSFDVSFARIPFLCASGMLRCVNMDDFDPKSCTRKSRALCLFLPDGAKLLSCSSKCDSLIRRCKARSFFTFATSAAASSKLTYFGSLCLECDERVA